MNYVVKVREEFTGDVLIEAEGEKEAKKKVKQNALSVAKNDFKWCNNPDTFTVEAVKKQKKEDD